MTQTDLYDLLLKTVAANLAVKFTDLTRKVAIADSAGMKSCLADLQRSGLVKIESFGKDEESPDAVVSITADGVKKAESLRSSGLTAFLRR